MGGNLKKVTRAEPLFCSSVGYTEEVAMETAIFFSLRFPSLPYSLTIYGSKHCGDIHVLTWSVEIAEKRIVIFEEYLFGRWSEAEEGRDFHLLFHPPKWLQQLEPAKPGVRNVFQVSHIKGRDSDVWAITLCSPRCISRKLDLQWSSSGLELTLQYGRHASQGAA